MRKIHFALAVAALLSAPVAFAAEDAANMPESKSCATIAQACKHAGFARTATPHTKFWHSCMKPVIMGQPVHGVKIDPNTAQACRTDKIDELKKELNELENTTTG